MKIKSLVSKVFFISVTSIFLSFSAQADEKNVCDGKGVTLMEYETSTDEILHALQLPISMLGAKKVTFYNKMERARASFGLEPLLPTKVIVRFGPDKTFDSKDSTLNCALAIAKYVKDYLLVNRGIEVDPIVQPLTTNEGRIANEIDIELPATL